MARRPTRMIGKPKRATVSESARLIRDLNRKGMSDAAIGRALGRDSSLIGQIRKGKKPGRNLTPALESLNAGNAPAPVSRRITRSGEVARVRTPDVQRATLHKSGDEALHRLENLAKKNARISLNAVPIGATQYANGRRIGAGRSVQLYGKSVSAADLLAKYQEQTAGLPPDLASFDQWIAGELRHVGVTADKGLERITINPLVTTSSIKRAKRRSKR